MGRARCTLTVHGLDCPSEVPPLRAALDGSPGVLGLAFDPAGGTVAIEYDPGTTAPTALAGRVAERVRMRAEVAEDVRPGDDAGRAWYRDPLWLTTLLAGTALGTGVASGWLRAPWPIE